MGLLILLLLSPILLAIGLIMVPICLFGTYTAIKVLSPSVNKILQDKNKNV